MIKFLLIAIIIIISYFMLLGLMKASGKKTPPMPDIQDNKTENNNL
ncbi:hypothetical protein LGK97_09405 [Clostridium sp. CS001]|nr:hypothetical protein [Clostridium sp. CS001]MCB2289982.1 hypothetical protein [Clostridium sp. CS001]